MRITQMHNSHKTVPVGKQKQSKNHVKSCPGHGGHVALQSSSIRSPLSQSDSQVAGATESGYLFGQNMDPQGKNKKKHNNKQTTKYLSDTSQWLERVLWVEQRDLLSIHTACSKLTLAIDDCYTACRKALVMQAISACSLRVQQCC